MPSEALNPYQPPTETSTVTVKSSAWSRLAVIALAATIGSVGGGMCEYLIYNGDPRLGKNAPTLTTTVLGGGLACGILWAVAGAIISINIKAVALVSAASFATGLLWVAIGGTYADVLGAATIFGWAGGALVAAIVVGHRDRSTRRLRTETP